MFRFFKSNLWYWKARNVVYSAMMIQYLLNDKVVSVSIHLHQLQMIEYWFENVINNVKLVMQYLRSDHAIYISIYL